MAEHCICPCWKDKEVVLTCYKCNGKIYYSKIVKVNEEDENKIKLEKLKKELQDKRVDMVILRNDIKELEHNIKESENDSSSSSGSVSSGGSASIDALLYFL